MNRDQRTEKIIEGVRGYESEYSRLQGVLCVTFGWDYADVQAFGELINTYRIAQRMDEITAEVIAKYKAGRILEVSGK